MLSQQPVGLPSGEMSLYQYIVIKLLDDRAGEMAQKPNALATLPEDPQELSQFQGSECSLLSSEGTACLWYTDISGKTPPGT